MSMKAIWLGYPGVDGERGFCRFDLGGASARWLFAKNPPDSAFRKFPSCASQRLGDRLVSAEAGELHAVDELADDVGVATNGRARSNERFSTLVLANAGTLALPPGDGAWGNTKQVSGLARGESAQTTDSQDPVPRLGSVQRALFVRNLVPALAEDQSKLVKEACLDGVRFGLGENDLERLAGIAKLVETGAEGKPQELFAFSKARTANRSRFRCFMSETNSGTKQLCRRAQRNGVLHSRSSRPDRDARKAEPPLRRRRGVGACRRRSSKRTRSQASESCATMHVSAVVLDEAEQ